MFFVGNKTRLSDGLNAIKTNPVKPKSPIVLEVSVP